MKRFTNTSAAQIKAGAVKALDMLSSNPDQMMNDEKPMLPTTKSWKTPFVNSFILFIFFFMSILSLMYDREHYISLMLICQAWYYIYGRGICSFSSSNLPFVKPCY